MSIQRIVVSTDFSEASRQPYAAAASLARRFRAELLLVHQVEILPVLPTAWPAESRAALDLDPEKITAELRKRLEEVAASDELFRGLDVRARLLDPGGVDTFARFLRDSEVDLLAMSTHGRRGFQRFMLGSYTEKMLHLSPCPVLVYRELDGQPADRDFSPRRILVPCDFSSAGDRAFDLARDWARVFEARASLLYVVERDTGVLGVAKDMVGGWTKYLDEMRHRARSEFESRIADGWKDVDARVEVAVGHPAIQILEKAKAFGADLIVMGTHGTTGMKHFLLGSVAERVVRRAECPVLVVRGTDGDA